MNRTDNNKMVDISAFVERMSNKLDTHMGTERFRRISDRVCMGILLFSFAAFIGVNLYFWIAR